MTALVAVETILLVLMAVLMVGLLRSHAEILRRLEGGRDAAQTASQLTLAQPRDDVPAAADVGGVTPAGDALQVSVGAPGTRTLLAFLTSGCGVCAGFWEALRAGAAASMPGGARIVVVTRDASRESPVKLRELAPPGLPVIMSDQAWEDYRVPLAPYFVLVDGDSGGVEGEGAAESWPQVASLLADAVADARDAREAGDRVERELAAAGIGVGHPSLTSSDIEAGP